MQEKSKATTKVRTQTLTAIEEKVVRMRHGLRAPADHNLEAVGRENPEVWAQLEAMERRALEAVGSRGGASKRNIISKLRTKS
jgi:DNA-directed RNA polymerase sigma subunit (sigma70/sigma32)